jgi:CubicO group peptidase (beta-lactamase class C family)
MKNAPAGCSLSVSLHGKTVFEGFKGLADIETKRKISPDTVYRMYSCSKIVTAAALMLLLERGLIKLDDPIEIYLPEFANPVYCHYTGNNLVTLKPAAPITIKHLVTMTSGLTYDGDAGTTQRAIRKVMLELNEKGGFTCREFASRISEVPLAFEPGTHWNYGVGHDVLGALIEVVAGKTFGEFLKDELFTPLGMSNTAFFISESNTDKLATLYMYENGALIPNRRDGYKFEKSYGFESGGGGLLSTLADMTRFAQMLSVGGTINNVRIMGKKTIELMRQNHLGADALSDFRNTHFNGWDFMQGYGYGLGVKTLIDLAGSNCLGTSGEFSWAGAAGTYILVDPVEELAIVYMHQLMPNNMEGYCHPRIKNVVYSHIL